MGRGSGGPNGNLHLEISELHVTVAKSLECVRLLGQLLTRGWCPRMGAIFVTVRWGNVRGSGGGEVDGPRPLQSGSASES